MRHRLDQAWRLLRTGLSFAVFGVGAVALAFVTIPLRRRLARDGECPELRAQRTLHRGARFFMGLVQRLGLVRLELVDTARLRDGRPRLVIANHPTLFDMVVLVSLMPQADCIVSGGWARNVFLRRLVAVAGYVRNDSGLAVVRGCLGRLRAGRSVVVFPEGTRSPAGGLGTFRAGAALVALKSGRDVLPVLLTCEPSTLTKGRSWYDVPDGPLHVTVEVGEPIPQPLVRDGGAGLSRAARALTAELREFFLKGLEIVDVGRT